MFGIYILCKCTWVTDPALFLPLPFPHPLFPFWDTRKTLLDKLRRGTYVQFSSVQFTHSVVSDSLRPHESQHTRPPCPSPTPEVHLNSCPSSRWCHPAISSSVVPFFFCPQTVPALGSFPMSQLFTWGGLSTGVLASASFLPKESQGWSPWSASDSQESSPTPQLKSINSSVLSLLHSPTLTSIHDHRKNHSLD